VTLTPRLKDNLSEQAAKRETDISLITGLQHNTQNMLAQAERQAKVNCIDKLGPFQNQITASCNKLDVLLNDLGQHAMGWR
jgi:hypothetical protein